MSIWMIAILNYSNNIQTYLSIPRECDVIHINVSPVCWTSIHDSKNLFCMLYTQSACAYLNPLNEFKHTWVSHENLMWSTLMWAQYVEPASTIRIYLGMLYTHLGIICLYKSAYKFSNYLSIPGETDMIHINVSPIRWSSIHDSNLPHTVPIGARIPRLFKRFQTFKGSNIEMFRLGFWSIQTHFTCEKRECIDMCVSTQTQNTPGVM
jgi:hypothetical protein